LPQDYNPPNTEWRIFYSMGDSVKKKKWQGRKAEELLKMKRLETSTRYNVSLSGHLVLTNRLQKCKFQAIRKN